MANQPPAARPWLRLPHLGRQAPPPPAPAAQPPPQPPRIPVIRPAFAQSFRPATIQPQPPLPPTRASPSPSPSPSPRHVSSSPSPTVTSPRTSGISSRSTSSSGSSTGHSSPAGRRSPSPVKEIHPPSHITLPPPHLNPFKGETEQKKVLLQETFNKPSSAKVSGKHDAPKDGRNARIITMAGENRGAIMELGYTSRRNKEGKHTLVSEAMIKDKKGAEKSLNLPMNVYVNSNVQGINSSLLFNCSFTHHDPGVHFSHSKKPIHGDRKGKDRGK